MPLYCYACPKGHKFDAFVALDERDKPRTCPNCRARAPRDRAAELGVGGATAPAAQVFQPYTDSSGGAFPHEMRDAKRLGNGDVIRLDKNGQPRRLNPPGMHLDRNGDVVIRTRAEERRYERMYGLRRHR